MPCYFEGSSTLLRDRVLYTPCCRLLSSWILQGPLSAVPCLGRGDILLQRLHVRRLALLVHEECVALLQCMHVSEQWQEHALFLVLFTWITSMFKPSESVTPERGRPGSGTLDLLQLWATACTAEPKSNNQPSGFLELCLICSDAGQRRSLHKCGFWECFSNSSCISR